jgi:hypothetical protein
MGEGPQVHFSRWKAVAGICAVALTSLFGVVGTGGLVTAATAQTASSYTPAATGELDCNGFSPVQKPLRPMECTDIRGDSAIDNSNTWGGRFYDNGHYIGHDEPDTTFLSSAPGSGGDVTWTETIGRDPLLPPTDARPGHDVSHWFELTPAPWMSMAICDPNSYPQAPCTPNSDSNAPTCFGPSCTASQSGGGSAFMEMQLYPPGNPPFVDSESCDDAHWCAALTIDSLECTAGFATCNTSCEEPVNFAFIQRDGVPTGPPSSQLSDVATFTANNQTLLMNPGDTITIHMFDGPAPGGGRAFEVVVHDLTQGTTGFMQASAANGFQNTSIADCSGTPFNFEPEYSTAAPGNIVPWAALQTNISTEFETGHFEACTSLGEPFETNPFDAADQSTGYNECFGPYENAGPPDSSTPEVGDAMCYYAGSTHQGFDGPGTSSAPDELTGCQDNLFQNGDLDFDGTPYWTEWPTGTIPTIYPSSFVESLPTSNGRQYSQFFFQTDIALSESTCLGNSLPGGGGTPSGCTVPPSGPGNFYPYWSELHVGNFCALEFGNVAYGPGITSFGQDAEYGQNLFSTLGYPEFESSAHANNCRSRFGQFGGD